MTEFKAIEVDLGTYKAIESFRQSFEESHNDILRRVIAKVRNDVATSNVKQGVGGYRVRDGVYLQAGTKLRHIAKRSGIHYDAEVADGGILYEGKLHHSPSNAAIAAVGGNRNGWLFWEYYDPQENQWKLLDSLRQSFKNKQGSK